MTLAELVGRARCLLVDFDGPICAVFAGLPAATVAAELHTVIRDHLNGVLPPDIAELTASPIQILRRVADLDDDALTRAVADACRDAEIRAVATATPTPGAHGLLRATHDTGRRVAIVSNNASAAIDAYLRSHDMARYIEVIMARSDGMDPRLLKPHPFLVEQGLKAACTGPGEAVFIGDSTTDIEAGQAAGTGTVGYANKPGKHQRLVDAGADVVIDAMQAFANGGWPVTTGTTL